jgi:hypothetical protein
MCTSHITIGANKKYALYKHVMYILYSIEALLIIIILKKYNLVYTPKLYSILYTLLYITSHM